ECRSHSKVWTPMQRHGDSWRYLAALHDSWRGDIWIAAIYSADGSVEPEINRKVFPDGLVHGAEIRLRHVSDHDSGLRLCSEEIFIGENSEAQAEATEVVGEKRGGVRLGVDGLAESFG